MTKPTIAVVGRANVGKSALFNRLISQPLSLVSPIAGTTRDRLEADCNWQGFIFRLIDTGGFDIDEKNPIERKVAEQTEKAIMNADLIYLVVDSKDGLIPNDKKFANFLKKNNKKTVVVANKADSLSIRNNINDFYQLGFDKVLPVSAANGSGAGDLLDETVEILKKMKIKKSKSREDDGKRSLKIMFVGQPNVGKSSLVNAILNEDRVIVSPTPHTTRGVQTIDFLYKKNKYSLLDTAGLRRNKKHTNTVEKFSIGQIENMLPLTDVVVFITDVSKRLSVQDKKIGDLIASNYINVILVANKWDLIPDKDEKTINKYIDYYYSYLPMINFAPIVFTSATENIRMRKILDLAKETNEERYRKITDNACDKFLKQAIKKNSPAKAKGTRHPYLVYFKQVGVNPPQFELGLDKKTSLASAYIKYLIKQLRLKFGFIGTPIKIDLKPIDLSHKSKLKMKN